MAEPGLEAGISAIHPVEEVVDLTGDDGLPPVKKRRSEKRERAERAFRSFLDSLPPADRFRIQSSYQTVCEEKDSILRLRLHYTNQDETPETGPLRNYVQLLSGELLYLDELATKIQSGKATPKEAMRMAEDAERSAKGIRGRIDSMRRERALKRLQRDTVRASHNQIVNDPSYIEARSRSLVTPVATTTNAAYRPEVNPLASNAQAYRSALQNRTHPGMLPDGSFVSAEAARRHLEFWRDMPLTPEDARADRLYSSSSADSYTSEGSFDSEPDEPAPSANKTYEDLVDLALNEAEPLDMPPQLNCTSLEHQRLGLGWLVRAERGSNKGSILADDMGLGKTVQTIALMYANPPKPADSVMPNANRLVLVVCPVALIATWADELKYRVHPSHRLRVYIHHKATNPQGYTTEQEEIESNADVVICTYQGLVNEYKSLERRRQQQQQEAGADSSGGGGGGGGGGVTSHSPRQVPSPLFRIAWHRIVLDEAHLIKNRATQMSLAASKLRATYRLALTGTPMQNKLEELFPIIRFLHIRPYDEFSEFRKLIPAVRKHGRSSFNEQKAFAAFLSAVMLRRRKDTIINGRKIIDNLPPKHVEDLNTAITDKVEADLYHGLEISIKEQAIAKNEEFTMSNILVLLLRMRQAACHPYLTLITRKSASHKVWGNNSYTKDAIKLALVMDSSLRARALELSDEERICAECDGEARSLPDSYAFSGCGHVLCAECSTRILMSAGSEDDSTPCPLCKVTSRFMANMEILDVIEKEQVHSHQAVLTALLYRQEPRVRELRKQEEVRKTKLLELKMRRNQAQVTTNMARLSNDLSSVDEDSDLDDLWEEASRTSQGAKPVERDVAAWQNSYENGSDTFASLSPVQNMGTSMGTDASTDVSTDDDSDLEFLARELSSSAEKPEQLMKNEISSEKELKSEQIVEEQITEDHSGLKTEWFVSAESASNELEVGLASVNDDDPLPSSQPLFLDKPEVENKIDAGLVVAHKDRPQNNIENDPLEYKMDIDELAKLFKIPGIFDDGWRSSTKVEACLDILRKIWRESPEDKVILFTSFTSLIDVLSIPLEAADIPHAQYTGKMNINERNDVLDNFRRGRCKVLLASLKAGNVGLTLTQANRVIIVEPFWNPYVEDQAQDRVYRIGQSREVTVYRVRIKETVEDRIVTLQDTKRAIIEGALDNSMKTRAQGLSRTDIMFALGLRNQPRSQESVLRQNSRME